MTEPPEESREERCPKCGKPVSHYEDREVRVRWCGFPEAHYWDWKLKVPKLQMRP
jgi:ribosomal protein L37E